MSKLVIVCGAPWEGLTIYGPFDSSEEAEDYQNHHLFGQDFWWIMPIEKKHVGLPLLIVEGRAEGRSE